MLTNSCTSLSLTSQTSNTNPTQQQHLANQSSNTQETCLICGDVASGKHYGLRSCEACKAFFKRTVQGKIEYSCPATRECEINKRRRKACQACRFQKCLNMGMLKEGVRLDRVRGGRQKYRRGLSPGPGVNSSNSSNNNNNSNSNTNNGQINSSSTNLSSSNILSSSAALVGVSGLSSSASSNHHHLTGINPSHELQTSASSLSAHSCTFSSQQQHHLQQQGSSSVAALCATNLSTSETTRIMTALINCEPEELSASPAQFIANIPSSLSVQTKTLYILSDLFDRELVSLIGWAKQIPGFTETITLNDQMRLLQSTWAEVIALSIGYRSHIKQVEASGQQHGIVNNNNNSNNYYHFINTTPSPTSSSPASTASGYNQQTCSNNNNSSNVNSSYSSLSSSSSSSASNYSYNLESNEIKLVFAKDLVIDFKHAVACGAEEIFYNCVQLVKRLEILKITTREFILLKAISLTNADVKLENSRAIHNLRDLLMDTLYEVTLAESAIQQMKLPSSNRAMELSEATLSSIGNGNNHMKFENQELSSNTANPFASSSSPKPSSSLAITAVAVSTSTAKTSSTCNSTNNNNASCSNSSSSSSSSSNSSSSGSSKHQPIDLDATNNAAISRRITVNHRISQVLLCLPILRQIDTCIRKFWNDVRKGPNNVPMNKLFEEMLEPCQRIHKSTL